MVFDPRALKRYNSVALSRNRQVSWYVFGSDDSAAEIVAAGYFNAARDVLRDGDTITVTADADGVFDRIVLRVSSVPLVGDITVTSVQGGPLAHPEWVADATRYMPFATRWKWPAGFNMAAASGLEAVGGLLVFASGPWDVTSPRFHYSGWAHTEGGNAPQETIYPSANFTVEDEISIDGGTTWYPLDFSGSSTGNLVAQTAGIWATVPGLLKIPKNTLFMMRPKMLVPASASYIGNYRIQRHRGERMWGAASISALKALMASNAPDTAALDQFYNTVGNASNSQLLLYGADLMVGLGWDGRPVPLVVNDSLLIRQELAASADARGNMGIGPRWFDTDDPQQGRMVPLVMGCPGAKSALELTGSGATIATRRWSIIDEVKTLNGGKNPFTVCFDFSGRNDNNATASTWANAKFGLIDRIKARYPGVAVVGGTLLATTTSSNAWMTTAGQTLAALWSTTLAAVNALVAGQVGNRYASLIDMFSYWSARDGSGKFPGALEFPLGTLIGHPGAQDGVTTWNTIVSAVDIPNGAGIMLEYQPGLYTGRTILSRAGNGDGSWTYTVQEVFATTVQDNAPIYGRTTADGTHSQLYHILDTVSRIPQAEKAKLYPAVSP